MQRLRSAVVPLPLAIVSGMLVGALVFLCKKRPVYYEVRPGRGGGQGGRFMCVWGGEGGQGGGGREGGCGDGGTGRG